VPAVFDRAPDVRGLAASSTKESILMLKPITTILSVAALAAFTAAHAQEAPPNDAQIAMIAVTADNVDIDAGKQAAAKTQNKEVKEFAETMVRDHTAVNNKAIALAKKLGVTPEESATSKSLKTNGDAELAKQKALTGAAFDKAYVDNEVAYHEAVAGVLDKTLLPNTKNAELKSLLESARPIFVSHLEHAKMLQKSLSK
jgi:putative membrane protein